MSRAYKQPHLHPYMLAAVPARIGAAKPPMLLEAVQKPQKVPRSLSAYHEVRKRAHAGAPSPCARYLPASAEGHRMKPVGESGLDFYHPSACDAHVPPQEPASLCTGIMKARHPQHDTCSSVGRDAPKAYLQDAIESPEGQ